MAAGDLLEPGASHAWTTAGAESGDFLAPAEAEGWDSWEAFACIPPTGPARQQSSAADFFWELDGEPAVVPAVEAGGGGVGCMERWAVEPEALLIFGYPAQV
jgi:hypothetical protein